MKLPRILRRGISRPARRRATPRLGLRPGAEALECRRLQDGAGLHFDFLGPWSAATAGTLPVTAQAYSPSVPYGPAHPYTPDRGYGWAGTAGIYGWTLSPGQFGAKSSHSGQDGTFLVDLPNGTYVVQAELGGAWTPTDEVAVWAEGTLEASGLSTGHLGVARPQFRVEVADGRLDLRFVDQGGFDPSFRIVALHVRPATGPAPTAGVGPDVAAAEGQAVTFQGQAGGGSGPLSYTWDFGDGATASGTLTPTHIYDDDGAYTVTLTVADDSGESARASATATIADVAPTVVLEGPEMGIAGLALAFAVTVSDPGAADSNRGFAYAWDFGDGTRSTAAAPGHVYDEPGLYPVALTVADQDGVTATATTTVQIKAGGLANVGLGPGWATFGQALPEGSARGALQVDDLATQTDVKVTWPDGSIRYAIVSAYVPAAGTYALHEAPPVTGHVPPVGYDTQVRFTIDGASYTAALPRLRPSDDTWLDGPLVTERRHVVAPAGPDGGLHPLLRVLLDVRSYRGGASRLDVTVENALNKAGAATVRYDVDIIAGGRVLFHRDAVAHSWLTRWRQVIDVGLKPSSVRLDFRPFYRADAIPHYLSDVSPMTYQATGPEFAILREGGVYPFMGAPGGRADIAPYPDWTARFIATQEADDRAITLANADLAGSWSVHYREPEGGTYTGLGADRLISIRERPRFWADPRGDAGQKPVATSETPLGVENAHIPSLVYVPYLATGDRYYADEVRFWANHLLLSMPGSQDHPRGSSGLIVGNAQPRAIAWALRDISDAAAYLPDNDPARAYFAGAVRANLDWLDNYARTNAGPLGMPWLYWGNGVRADNPAVRVLMAQPWQHTFLAWAIDHANRHGFSGGAAFRDAAVGFQLRLFTSPDYPRAYAGPGAIAIGDWVPDETGKFVLKPYTTLEEVFRTTYAAGAPPTPFDGFYGLDSFVALQLAVAGDMPGAEAALAWLYPQITAYLRRRAGWDFTLIAGR